MSNWWLYIIAFYILFGCIIITLVSEGPVIWKQYIVLEFIYIREERDIL